jgi:hypothetical protein
MDIANVSTQPGSQIRSLCVLSGAIDHLRDRIRGIHLKALSRQVNRDHTRAAPDLQNPRVGLQA